MYEMSSVGNYKDVSTIQEYIELFTKHISLSKFDFFTKIYWKKNGKKTETKSSFYQK